MALLETEGIILKTYALSDADKIAVVFTEKFGLIRGVAKGAKRLKSKFGGSLEPLSVGELTYVQKEERELVAIQDMELRSSYFSTASDPHFLESFGRLIELLTDFVPPNDPNRRLYKMVKACLETSDPDPKKLDYIAFYFEFWLLRLGGYLPRWDVCGDCGRAISDSERTNLQVDFRLLCLDCADPKNGRFLRDQIRGFFLRARSVSPEDFLKETPEKIEEDFLDASAILKRIISRVLDKEILSPQKVKTGK